MLDHLITMTIVLCLQTNVTLIRLNKAKDLGSQTFLGLQLVLKLGCQYCHTQPQRSAKLYCHTWPQPPNEKPQYNIKESSQKVKGSQEHL